MKESKVIIISHYVEQEQRKEYFYFVVSFKRTIFVINQSRINILQNFLSKKEKLEICFLSDTKTIFDEINSKENENELKYKEIKNDEYFEDEINEINSNFFKIPSINFPHNDILHIIKSSISGYLLKQSYYTYDRMDNFNNEINTIKPKLIKEEDIIQLRVIGIEDKSNVYLYYYIEYEKLVVIKKYSSYSQEREKLLKRDIRNYEEIKHPFIPKFYGTIKYDELFYPVIEFINGSTLLDTDLSQFSETDIYEIILQMILAINYLHNNHFIYRDLKPNNVIIDDNKTFVLIDFDRMIKNDEYTKTIDFSSSYLAPEVISNESINNKCDIFSIGKMIYFMLTEKQSLIKNYENTKLYQIYKKCISDNAEQRQNSTELIDDFIFFIKQNNINIKKVIYYLTLAANQNHPQAQYNLGFIYFSGQYISRDMNKVIYYLTLAANQNHPKAQNSLGVIYSKGQYISRDMNKAIYYLTLASNQNDPEAQYNLGFLYLEGQYISRDMNKAIYYLTLASNQNDPEAQYNLGVIYYKGQYISQDMNKAIHYLTLAANQNYIQAQYNLGFIYYSGQYISRDMNKVIYYLTLAANQNYPEAQNTLGFLYYKGQYISRDMNKAIYYLTLAANQNIPAAQNNLGFIYYKGQYISRDMNKAIYYITLAANQNYLQAQYNLGFIYYSGQYISRDMNKVIYYLTLASNQNIPAAQNNLGFIYYKGQYISRDMNKAIYYLTLAANQNYLAAQNNLGIIYYKGQYISRDMNKAIYYFSLAANQNHPEAQFNLGFLYLEGQYISRDMNKSIYYLTLAADQNYPEAQFYLGLIFIENNDDVKTIIKGIDLLIQSASNGNIDAHFCVGFFYHEGRYVQKNIEKCIHHYKEASSFNNQYAKNNLGIIYKNGISEEIPQNIGYAIEYFKEAIRQEKDILSMYNLSHIYIYEIETEEKIDESINLLIKSLNYSFSPCESLLSISLIKKYSFDFEIIYKYLNEKTNKSNADKIITIIYSYLYDEASFTRYYEKYKTINFVYNYMFVPIESNNLFFQEIKQPEEDQTRKNITKYFYEGFGHDLLLSNS